MAYICGKHVRIMGSPIVDSKVQVILWSGLWGLEEDGGRWRKEVQKSKHQGFFKQGLELWLSR